MFWSSVYGYEWCSGMSHISDVIHFHMIPWFSGDYFFTWFIYCTVCIDMCDIWGCSRSSHDFSYSYIFIYDLFSSDSFIFTGLVYFHIKIFYIWFIYLAHSILLHMNHLFINCFFSLNINKISDAIHFHMIHWFLRNYVFFTGFNYCTVFIDMRDGCGSWLVLLDFHMILYTDMTHIFSHMICHMIHLFSHMIHRHRFKLFSYLNILLMIHLFGTFDYFSNESFIY